MRWRLSLLGVGLVQRPPCACAWTCGDRTWPVLLFLTSPGDVTGGAAAAAAGPLCIGVRNKNDPRAQGSSSFSSEHPLSHEYDGLRERWSSEFGRRGRVGTVAFWRSSSSRISVSRRRRSERLGGRGTWSCWMELRRMRVGEEERGDCAPPPARRCCGDGEREVSRRGDGAWMWTDIARVGLQRAGVVKNIGGAIENTWWWWWLC